MSTPVYGPAFSKAVIDASPLPSVSPALLPWLRKDRVEAIEGAYVTDSKGKVVHDGTGLDKARRSLRAAETALAELELEPGDTGRPVDQVAATFLTFQRGAAMGKVSFYEGKVYLLDKLIASLEKA